MDMHRLVIRNCLGKYLICTGEAPKGKENDGLLYVGTIVGTFTSFEKAQAARLLIEKIYC